MYSTLRRQVLKELVATSLLLASGGLVEAQDVQTNAPEPAASLNEVVVTGTLIRGIAPPSGNLISLDPTAIAATGASNTNEVLNNIPQLGDFGNTNAQVSRTNGFITVVRPNIRNLPGLTVSGGSTTLLLVDGHRLVGAGIQETAPDPNVIPPSLLERVEILPDGGSSTYGADAIGGVINFITRRHFDGEQADARVGFANDYRTYDANATIGRDWGRFSAYLSYAYTQSDPLFGADRDYVKHYGPNGQLLPDRTCIPGNVIVRSGAATITYAQPGLQPNTANACDTSDYSTFYPYLRRHSVFLGASDDISDALKLDVRGYYTTQFQLNTNGAFTATSAITAANPYYERVASNPAPQPALPESVAYTFAPVSGYRASFNSTKVSSWGATPTLSLDLGSTGWQLREMINYGGSDTKVFNTATNPTALAGALASNNPTAALDPYNIALTNPTVIANIENYELYAKSTQELIDERLVADGGLFPLPGGQVHLAVGSEFMHEEYKGKQGNFVIGNEGSVPFAQGSRNSYAFFGEVDIPIVGTDNAVTGIRSLSLNSSARFDHYSDFGQTFNPKFALAYEPIDWIKIRGNWGRAFNAPSLADTHAVNNALLIVPASVYPNVLPGQFQPAQSLYPEITVLGGLSNLKPQTGHTYEIGTDITVPFEREIKLSLTYWHIDFFNVIGSPPVGSPFTFFSNYGQFYTMAPTQAQVNALASQVPNGAAQVAPYFLPGSLPVYMLVDDRRRNLGNARLAGLDFSLDWVHRTSFGAIDANFDGSYDLKSESQPLPGLAYANLIDQGFNRFRFAATLGTTVGDLRAQATVRYLNGFKVAPSAADNNQTDVGSFTTVDLFLRYDLTHQSLINTGLTDKLALTLSVNNLLNQDPPVYYGSYASLYNGYANGSTVGRLFQVGFDKKF